MLKKYYLIIIPIVYLIISFMYVIFYHDSFDLYNLAIHESGKLSFLGTLFYTDHFLGQLPQNILNSFLICILVRYLDKEVNIASPIGAILTLIIISIIYSYYKVGPDELIKTILQYKENDNIYRFGGNWSLSLTSNIFNMTLFFIFITRDSFKLLIASSTFFLIVTLVLTDTAYALTNTRYIFHNSREIFNNLILTFPIVLFALGIRSIPSFKLSYLLIPLSVILYHLSFLLHTSPKSLSQHPEFMTQVDLPYLLFSHSFEHFLDIVFIFFLCQIILTVNQDNDKHHLAYHKRL